MTVDWDSLMQEVYGTGIAKTSAARWPSTYPLKINPRSVQHPSRIRQEVTESDLPWRDRLAQFRKMLDDGLTTE